MLLRLFFFALLLAALLWVLRGPPETGDLLPEVLVTEADVAHIHARWMRQWNRPPTAGELRGALDAYVRDEVLYREALARGMDREDPTVRLALIQKMRMLAAGRADAQNIGEEDLVAFFALRRERYRIPARLDVAHVYFQADGDPAAAEQRARDTLAAFRARDPGADEAADAGDRIMMETTYHDLTPSELERLFGTDFAAAVLPLPTGEWSGPVRSGYGLHLVKILRRTPGRIPSLDEVRDRVADDLAYENRKAAEEQGYQEIAGKYRVALTRGARALIEGEIKTP